MELKPIKSTLEYQEILTWVDTQFDLNHPVDSPEGEKLQIALLLIKSYEDAHFQIPFPDPIEAIKLKMTDRGMLNQDLVEWVGSKSYVSAILNKKKPLTLKIAKIFHQKLGISAEILLS